MSNKHQKNNLWFHSSQKSCFLLFWIFQNWLWSMHNAERSLLKIHGTDQATSKPSKCNGCHVHWMKPNPSWLPFDCYVRRRKTASNALHWFPGLVTDLFFTTRLFEKLLWVFHFLSLHLIVRICLTVFLHFSWTMMSSNYAWPLPCHFRLWVSWQQSSPDRPFDSQYPTEQTQLCGISYPVSRNFIQSFSF